MKVKIIDGDQDSYNCSLYQTHLKVDVKKPYFIHRDEKIFAMYDPPHLIKSVRNNFKKHGFQVDGKDVIWDHVKEFFDIDQSKPVRLAPKLTKQHIDLPPFSPLRVRLATQVLSHSVSAGIQFMAEEQLIVYRADGSVVQLLQ